MLLQCAPAPLCCWLKPRRRRLEFRRKRRIGKRNASDIFFERGEIPRLKITIPQAELERLNQNNRDYVRCAIKENDKTEYFSVGIKLKGAAGSFRGIDDKPALTLNFDKFRDHQTFHGLDKMHLNNSVQDPTYLNELICSELFLAAGVPTPRTTHARVWINGRDAGFYVLKEGFDGAFLKRHFGDGKGNLYDGGFLQDLDANLEKDSGDGPDDRSDLKGGGRCRAGARCPEAMAADRGAGGRGQNTHVYGAGVDGLPLGRLFTQPEQLPRVLRREDQRRCCSCRMAWTRCSATRTRACSIIRGQCCRRRFCQTRNGAPRIAIG